MPGVMPPEWSFKKDMDKAAYRTLVILIRLCALGCACVCLALWAASGFVGGEIDYTEAQRQAARGWAALIALSGFLGLLASVSAMFLSGRIARFILMLFGAGGAA
jgi:hypothetical protein